MRRKNIVWMTVVGVVMGACIAAGAWIFRPQAAQAQCVQLFLTSCTTGGCGCLGGIKLNETQSDGGWYVALCARP